MLRYAVPLMVVVAASASAVVYLARDEACRKPSGGKANARLAEPVVLKAADEWARNLPATVSGAGLQFAVGQAGPAGLMVEIQARSSGETLLLALSQRCDGGGWTVVARQAGV